MSFDQVCPSFHLLLSCSCPRFALSVRRETSLVQRVAADYPLKYGPFGVKPGILGPGLTCIIVQLDV